MMKSGVCLCPAIVIGAGGLTALSAIVSVVIGLVTAVENIAYGLRVKISCLTVVRGAIVEVVKVADS